MDLGQIFWLIIPYFNAEKKNKSIPHALLVYEINGKNYTFLVITSNDKEKSMPLIPQYRIINRPSTLDKNSFIDLNFLVYIEHELFSNLLDVAKKQGQLISLDEFTIIKKEVKFCFSNKNFCGNRYELRVK